MLTSRLSIALALAVLAACSSTGRTADRGTATRDPGSGAPESGPSDDCPPDLANATCASEGASCSRGCGAGATCSGGLWHPYEFPCTAGAGTCTAVPGARCVLTAAPNLADQCPAGEVMLGAMCEETPNLSCCQRPADAKPPGTICAANGGACAPACAGASLSLAHSNDCEDGIWCCGSDVPDAGGAG